VHGALEEKLKKGLDKIRNIIKTENLRTLMLFGSFDARFVDIFSDLFKNAKSLRVVVLSTNYYPVEALLHNFSKLVHLHYLRLVSARYGKENLPRNISRFYHLRVLDIACWYGSHSLLGDLANLVKLRHFLVSSENDKFHSNICNVGKLHSLQELQRFEVRKESSGFELRELGKLEELGGSLGIYNLESALLNDAHEAKISYKNRLQKLTLNWKKRRSNTNPTLEDQLLESLRPHNNIHKLFIDGHGGSTCPTWLGTNLSTRGLEALCLDSTDWESLPPLGDIYLVRKTGEEYLGCIRGPNFHNLKRLELIGLPRFRRWVANEFCPWYFSVIEVLIVKKCPRLTELPFSSYTTCNPPEGVLNATWFPRLTEIEIENCPNLLSLPPIPFSHSLCSVKLEHVGRGLDRLHYSNKTSISLWLIANDTLVGLDETVLAFDNLTQLQILRIENCPPLSEEHLQMLTSLKTLQIKGSSITFPPLVKSDVKWQLLVTSLYVGRWTASGKELTRLLSHLPKLSDLFISEFDKITLLGVEVEQKQTTTWLSAASAVKLQDTDKIDEQQEVALEVEEEVRAEEVVGEQKEDDGLLLLPANLSSSLQDFVIWNCLELILTVQDRGAGGGGLQSMHSLERLDIQNCPKFLSAFTASDLSCCPLPSSLQQLQLSQPLSNLTSLQNADGLLPLLTKGQLTTLQVRHNPNFFAGWDPTQELQGGQEQPSSNCRNSRRTTSQESLLCPSAISSLPRSLNYLINITMRQSA
jgi:hypothetical protein